MGSDKLFSSALGKRIYNLASEAISDFSMDTQLRGGVLVGFSGGADSLMLLNFLLEYRKNNFDFPILAVHVNHMIRGKDADADEQLSRKYAQALGVEFISLRRDVPSIAAEGGVGLEEAARNARYSCFLDIIQSRNDISCIATAHNSTDNLETVIFNMMRGAGVRGMCGIAPVRENIIRPLLYCTSFDIRAALDDADLRYAVDKTNFDTEYSRNYIRHEIIPKLTKISPDPEGAVRKSCSNIRSASDFIGSYAASFIGGRTNIPRSELASLERAPFAEVIRKMFSQSSDKMLELTHIDAIYSQLDKDNFSVSLPDELSFVAERGSCRITKPEENADFFYRLSIGENDIPEYGAKIFVDIGEREKTYSNVYNFSIQLAIPFDIIVGELYIRNKHDGDTCRMSGMTKKVKRMLCDADIPKSLRGRIPVFCDDSGILWIPGFKPRDFDKSNGGRTAYITLVLTDLKRERRFYIADKRNFPENV